MGCDEWRKRENWLTWTPGRSPPGSSNRGDSPGQNPAVGCHFLLQGIFPTQGSNPGLLHSWWCLYRLSHQGSPGEPQCGSDAAGHPLEELTESEILDFADLCLKNEQRLILTGKRPEWARNHCVASQARGDFPCSRLQLLLVPKLIYSCRRWGVRLVALGPPSDLACFSVLSPAWVGADNTFFQQEVPPFSVCGRVEADKLGVETQNRFLLHPRAALWSEREPGPGLARLPPGGGRMARLWASGELSPAFVQELLGD